MKNSIKKSTSLAELKRQLAAVLGELEVDNAWLRMGKAIEQQPVAKRIGRLAGIIMELRARGERIKLDTRNWAPELLRELALNEKLGPFIQAMELKEALLKARQGKLRQFQAGKRKRLGPRP